MSYGLGSNQLTSTQKLRQEIVVKMNDGSVFLGRIFLGFNERVLDMLNDKRSFIPIELDTKNIILIAVNSVMCVDLFQPTSENAAKFDNNMMSSCLYTHKSLDHHQNKIEYHKKIYHKYTGIINILESDIFKDKISKDTIFEESVLEIFNILQQLSEIIENN